MQFTELLDQIRSHYIERLLAAIAEARTEEDVTVMHEPALRDEVGKIVRSGPLDTPLRVDIVKVKDREVVDSMNVDTEEMLSFEPFTFTWPTNQLQVTVEPFQWNWLQLQTRADPDANAWHVIRAWYLKWFGENNPPVDQLTGTVHFMDDPQIEGDSIQLTIDLGTSPVESFEELLDALGEFGAKEVRIGQFGNSVPSTQYPVLSTEY